MTVRSEQTKFIVVLLCVLLTAVAPWPARTQMLSLWADDAMCGCDFFSTSPYQPFNVYVFLDPDTEGAFSVEYKLKTLPGHFSTARVLSPVVSGATIGTWLGSPGISAPFTSCQTETFWVVNLTMMAPDLNPGYYMLAPNDDSDFMGVTICPDPRPMVAATVYNVFGYNDYCSA